MIIVGIDPGSLHMGWGVLNMQHGRLEYMAADTLHAPKTSLPQRLKFMADALDHILQQFSPDAAAVEMIFHAKNSQSALTLGHARGVALLCLARSQVPVFEYTATQIKQSTTGHGLSDKRQVQHMVRILIHGVPNLNMGTDASDALAVAMTHAYRS